MPWYMSELKAPFLTDLTVSFIYEIVFDPNLWISLIK